ncbi:uncharacterized protein LOC5573307 [Aedes aegypti]|uniref:Ig-like domain-containing protein n=1 Tax=Aedes aegypti TaxID=7159 RepID=A0A903ULS3_AEDAE|nr:uncharacterized protein LOC5573307 [Aedes aegypti]
MLVKIVVGVLFRILILTGIFPLQLTRIHIPAYKFRGGSAQLECEYELKGARTNPEESIRGSHPRNRYIYRDDYYNDGDSDGQGGSGSEKLYSVKWYKDNEEFYRYVPSANPPIKSYKIEGIRVDTDHSNHSKVTLRMLTLKSSGLYRCEISAEAPSFDSVQGDGRMDVIVIPKDGPTISGDSERDSYHMGETLELNCTSGRSYPATTLQWYINDNLVLEPSMLVSYPRFQNPHGLITSYLGLSVVVGPHHYVNGEMRIKCMASMSPVLWSGGQESVLQHPTFDHREAMLLVRSLSWQVRSKSPIILTAVAIYLLVIS